MAHELANFDGQDAMFYVGDKKPWHGLGTKLVNPPTIEEAIKFAGLDWMVGLKEIQTVDGQKLTHKATYNQKTGQILGVVGPGYTPLQNIEAFNFFQPFLDSKEVTLETAGALREGKRIWVLAKINRDPLEIVKNDIVEKYILLSNAHDGIMATRVGFTPIRPVCMNTLQLALENQESQLIRIRHHKGINKSLENVRETMNAIDAKFETTAKEYYKLLADTSISSVDLKKYITIVLNFKEGESGLSSRALETVNSVIDLFENGRGTDIKGVRGTYWGAYNAITERLSHVTGKDLENRYDRLWFGDSATVGKKALEIAITMAKAA